MYDDYISVRVNMISNMRADLIIGDSKTAEFVDFCTNIEEGDLFFARHPYKIYPVLDARSNSARFFLELTYKKPNTIDLSEYANSRRCIRT
jgi:hypothetical protein